MSPSGAKTGYPDWAKLSQEDSVSIYDDHTGVAHNGVVIVVTSADVRRFERVAGRLLTSQPVSWVFSWSLDQAGLVGVGQRRIVTGPSMPNAAQLNMPNLGPWLTVTASPGLGGAWTSTSLLYATNRPVAYDLTPIFPLIIDQQLNAIGIGALATYTALDYWAGPARVYVTGSVAGNLVAFVQDIDSTGATSTFDQATIATSGSFATVIPAGAWQLVVNNQAGAVQNIRAVVVPSMTGAT